MAQGIGAARRGSVLTAAEIHRRAERLRSLGRSESVAPARLESQDSERAPDPLPPIFRQLLGEIGADGQKLGVLL